MGTTIVAMLATGRNMAVAHVGDSRLYLMRGGTLQQLTADDSWAAAILAHDPHLSEADLAKHPMRNMLTNVLGAREQVDVHLSEHVLLPGDTILICSDGLHGVVDAVTLATVIGGQPDINRLARQLVDLALNRGSRDNVTALVVRYEGGGH